MGKKRGFTEGKMAEKSELKKKEVKDMIMNEKRKTPVGRISVPRVSSEGKTTGGIWGLEGKGS